MFPMEETSEKLADFISYTHSRQAPAEHTVLSNAQKAATSLSAWGPRQT